MSIRYKIGTYDKTPEYLAWKNMRSRCLQSTAHNYANYGGRGITISAEWNSFEIFYRDMGLRPSANYSLERRDNNKGYSKENCYWATASKQRRNQELQTKAPAHNTSGIRGVSYGRRDKTWLAFFQESYKQVKLYRGYDFFEACCARKAWEAHQ